MNEVRIYSPSFAHDLGDPVVSRLFRDMVAAISGVWSDAVRKLQATEGIIVDQCRIVRFGKLVYISIEGIASVATGSVTLEIKSDCKTVLSGFNCAAIIDGEKIFLSQMSNGIFLASGVYVSA